MTNSIIKIEALKIAISRTKHGVTRINDVVRDVNTVWTDAGEPYPLPYGEYKRRAWLLADLERMLAQMIDEAHSEALGIDEQFDFYNHPEWHRQLIAKAHHEALRNNELINASLLLISNDRGAWNSASLLFRKMVVTMVHSEALEGLSDAEIEQRSSCWQRT